MVMYKIKKHSWGLFLTFGGRMDSREWEKWLEDSQKVLNQVEGPFGVVVDMRTLEILNREAQDVIIRGQRIYKDKGMRRSAVVINAALTNMQFQRIARESGIHPEERYIDAWEVPNWRAVALNWVEKGVEPPVWKDFSGDREQGEQ